MCAIKALLFALLFCVNAFEKNTLYHSTKKETEIFAFKQTATSYLKLEELSEVHFLSG